MAAALLSVASHMSGVVYPLCVAAALVPVPLVLMLVQLLADTGLHYLLHLILAGHLVHMHAGCCGLTAQGKHGHKSHHYEFSNVLFHGLCLWFARSFMPRT